MASAAPSDAHAAPSKTPPKVVILGGGVIGCSVAYFLRRVLYTGPHTTASACARGVPSTIVERCEIAAAASGKSGGFLAGGWGDGGVTQALHRESFALHERLAADLELKARSPHAGPRTTAVPRFQSPPSTPLNSTPDAFELHPDIIASYATALKTYRKIPTLSVAGGGSLSAQKPPLVSWLDGEIASCLMMDDATAQVTPLELTTRLHEEAMKLEGSRTIIGEVAGVRLAARDGSNGRSASVTGVEVVDAETGEMSVLDADVCVVAMGPWSTRASEWFEIDVPMTGIKARTISHWSPYDRSVSLLYDASEAVANEPAALFCAEDENDCHLEVYPRSTGEVYICGVGGSEYVDETRLLPGGDLDRADVVTPDPSRVAAGAKSFAGLSASVGAGGPRKTQSCMRPCPPDALPILGAVPGVDGAYMACGHNCWGILWAPVTGRIVSELVVDGKSRTKIDAFSPGRFTRERGGGRGRGKKIRGDDVGEQW
ncbi:uncharacterized protein MICPUCDRAFT_54289 [Micromonas pusilla CCMP1545]|uniref:Predicted protein n=1 Tax=Micromonas pusilla (strain CCMP1545) TaxID=564608 RepID=C1N8Y6_MICPC|nr:uncharacterized protein MICPUCDRAFT_54289 [Micromonas pusilla CCMP1545]EEH51267.1 predicted protein [Micromonas pusilla CCMP1545]|eukprot:XP_003064362.1 predicted protein [Micromonas pusilla CCMP1545]